MSFFTRDLKLSPLLAQLLFQRKILNQDDARRFLHGTLSDLPNPFLLRQMDRAVERIIEAIQKKQKILFFGDYDVDGITGTAQMQSFFRELGVPTSALLPTRLEDGYGLNERSALKILARKPDLLVTIDNGTTATSEVRQLVASGIDVIIVDHHETPSEKDPPPALAIVNPKADNPGFPDRNIASAGLVFLFLMALRARLRDRGVSPLPNLKRYLDLAALGTIADIVPMTGTNRLIVKFGLEEIGNTTRLGLKALMEVSTVVPPVNVGHVAFRLAPRINASGRLADPRLALDLLLSEDPKEAQTLARQLDDLNQERQQIEESVCREAILQVEEKQRHCKGLVVYGKDWHIGVVGIVASKLTETFGKPAVVLALSEDGSEARGSARTVGRLSVYQALKKVEHEMMRFGGHDAAAGMTVAANNLESFAEGFDRSVADLWDETCRPTLWIDSELNLSKIDRQLIRDLSLLEPHGPGNPEPVFMTDTVRIQSPKVVGKGHLKMVLKQEEILFDAIGFGQGPYLETALASSHHHIAFVPQVNEWNGTEKIQLKIKRIKPRI